MGFKQTQWVTDALITTQALTGEWGFLLLLARYSDQASSTFARGQNFCAAQLNVSDRQIRSYIHKWKERGVLVVERHGGGPQRTPGILRIDYAALFNYQLAFCRTNGIPPPTPDGKPPEISGESAIPRTPPEASRPEKRVELAQWKRNLRSSGRITGR